MYLSNIKIYNFRCYGEETAGADIQFKPGLSAIIGPNDGGKTTIIDAMRFALGTSDQDRIWLEDEDFHNGSEKISIICIFEDLDTEDQQLFAEYITHGRTEGTPPKLIINWQAINTGEFKKGRAYRRIEIKSGIDGCGKSISNDDRLYLQATYLRPLRNAADALSAGRGSRLAQVLQQSSLIKSGNNKCEMEIALQSQDLSIIGITDLVNRLLSNQTGVENTRNEINEHLKNLALKSESLISSIKVDGDNVNQDIRLKEILEKLDLKLTGNGKLGLGSDNLLFMACELILLSNETEGAKILLIEEPEAHLHTQRQLQVMNYLKKQADEKKIQIIVTTHSPNLSSAIDLENIILLRGHRGFSLGKDYTELTSSDYGFLKRFLDVTKANLFFAHGVLIVEGDAENILLPTIARILDKDLTENGISIVNVGGVGVGRYARIFKRKSVGPQGEIGIKVACLTDSDIMPQCAPNIVGLLKTGETPSPKRRWRTIDDFADEATLIKEKEAKCTAIDGQGVKLFISDHWTFEYDLALGPKDENGVFTGGIGEYVFIAAYLALNEEKIFSASKKREDLITEAKQAHGEIVTSAIQSGSSTKEEVIASKIYKLFKKDNASKAIAAQYLADLISDDFKEKKLTKEILSSKLPQYIKDAIEHVTSTPPNTAAETPSDSNCESIDAQESTIKVDEVVHSAPHNALSNIHPTAPANPQQQP